jgi:hypothetical protein
MKSVTRTSDSSQPAAESAVYLFDDWFHPIEAGRTCLFCISCGLSAGCDKKDSSV